MSLMDILYFLIAIATIATGLVALIRPRSITGFIGLQAPGGRGISELRSIFGGTFLGLGIAPLLLGDPAYTMLGLTYALIGAARAISILIDRSTENSNIISLVVEILFAVILLI
ncbi:MAG: DUF4345 family protein [Anaerolineales bacterium]|nr:DUF4345 family protein [Anaerolineales bacterium]